MKIWRFPMFDTRFRRLCAFALLCMIPISGCSGSPSASPPPDENPFAESRRNAPAPVGSLASARNSRSSTAKPDLDADSRQVAKVKVDGIDRNMPPVTRKDDTAADVPSRPVASSSHVPNSSPRTTSIPSAPIPEETLQVEGAWPQFRGPGGMGISEEVGLPQEWSDDENLVWKVKLPGPGSSSPIVYDDQVFVTFSTGRPDASTESGGLKRYLACFDRTTGTRLWESDPIPQLGREEPLSGFHARHGYASSTPCTDGQRIYCFFGTSGVAAFDRDGGLIWHNQETAGQGTDSWGSGSSPIVYRDLVIINACVESESLVALNKQTGDLVWKAQNVHRSWATPVLVHGTGSEPEVVLNTKNMIVSLNPLTGDVLWYCSGVSDYVCPSVVAQYGNVFAIGGRKGTAIAVQAGGQGAVDRDKVVWRAEKGANVPSPVVYGSHLYWVDEAGVGCCMSLLNGEVVTQKRFHTGDVYASMVVGDGKFYVVSRERGTFVLSANPDMKLLAHNTFKSDASVFNGSPAVAAECLFLRSNDFLYCVGQK